MSITVESVLSSLTTVIDPDFKKDIVSLGFVKDVVVSGSKISFTVELTTPACPLKEKIEKDCREAVLKATGSQDILINMTANVTTRTTGNASLPGVKNVLAVASGKGGVGKSTVAANLAIALSKTGAKVGLIDADIYGPSIPIMFDLKTARPEVDGKRLIPIEKYGIKLMSIGFMVDPDQAVIWRGPMASSALRQFITDSNWGELDYLVIDMPPGTGDIQLTLVQTIPLTGSVIVTTPQDVALSDAIKGIAMFNNVNVPCLGVIENMSYFICGHCGEREEIFSYGGGTKTAEQLNVPFLGEIPIVTNIRKQGDSGMPIALSHPDSPSAKVFDEVAGRLAQQISIRNRENLTSKPVEILFK